MPGIDRSVIHERLLEWGFVAASLPTNLPLLAQRDGQLYHREADKRTAVIFDEDSIATWSGAAPHRVVSIEAFERDYSRPSSTTHAALRELKSVIEAETATDQEAAFHRLRARLGLGRDSI